MHYDACLTLSVPKDINGQASSLYWAPMKIVDKHLDHGVWLDGPQILRMDVWYFDC